MPEILELLKRDRSLDTKSISSQMMAVADRKRLTFRRRAVSYSLTILKTQGWASNPTRGLWSITESGATVTLDEHHVDALGRKLWAK